MSLLPWQGSSWAQLYSYIQQNRIPQALLVSGQHGIGKQHLAKQFAYALLCSAKLANGLSCGRCHSCLLLNAETHPDFIFIKPEGPSKPITIDQVRQLTNILTLKPQYETQRIVIIEPADLMNINAVNAFLKCLEEPAERTSLILLTDKPSRLPATISSRCQKLAITKPEGQIVKTWLKQQQPTVTEPILTTLLGLAQGSPLTALRYLQEDTLSQRNECFSAWLAIAQHRQHPVNIVESWLKLPEGQLLFWMTSWVIDLLRLAYQGKSGQLFNQDLADALQGLVYRLELKELYRHYDLLLNSRALLDTQVNKQILFEELLIHWLQLNRSK